jgi:TPR repeat protein
MNLQDAADLYRDACEDSHGEACFRLAQMHETGAGVWRDPKYAERLRKRSCDHGYTPACEQKENG